MAMVSPELLRRFPFFAGLSEDQLRGLAMISEEQSFPAGANIVAEGEQVGKLYVLTSGSVELLIECGGPGQSAQIYVGSVTVGEPFALAAMSEPYSSTATARAEEPVRAIAIEATALRAMCAVDCRLGYALLQQINRALRERLNATRVQLAGQIST